MQGRYFKYFAGLFCREEGVALEQPHRMFQSRSERPGGFRDSGHGVLSASGDGAHSYNRISRGEMSKPGPGPRSGPILMLRRRFLKQLAAAATVSTATAFGSERARGSQRRPLRVGVVGAGIVGASIAYHLSRAGARVTVFEKAQPGSGATQNSFAWLNAFVADPHYRALRLQSLMAYHDLDARLKLGILWGGYTSWAIQRLRCSRSRKAPRKWLRPRTPCVRSMRRSWSR